MDKQEFSRRTRFLAIRIIRMTEAMPRCQSARTITQQILRCGMSVGANYHAALKARSPRDFVHKLHIVEEECDEVIYWLHLIIDLGYFPRTRLDPLLQEADEILSMIVAALKTIRRKQGSETRDS